MAKCIMELEKIYDIKRGDRKSNLPLASLKSQEDIAEELGINIDTYRRDKKLLELIPELQDLLLEGKLTTSVASRLLARLPQEEQNELLEELGQDKVQEMTQKQMQEYIDKIKNKDEENEKLKQLLETEKNKPKEKEYVETVLDKTDYSVISAIFHHILISLGLSNDGNISLF